jgi:hypothetical protein
LNQRFEWNLFFVFVAGQSLVLQWIQQGPYDLLLLQGIMREYGCIL